MTRATNFGRKRTYLEAGFGAPVEGQSAQPSEQDTAPPVEEDNTNNATPADGEPPKKKKRIRRKKPKASTEAGTVKEGGASSNGPAGEGQAGADGKEGNAPSRKALKKKKWREKEQEKKQRRLISSETRRQKRIQERFADTTCFACREKGHAAKDCPKVQTEGGASGPEAKAKVQSVGICYRCSSTRHTLSRCKKTVDESNPLPFASCFVCNGKGHLASSCPQNKGKGIYPNGGCCKLCGDKTHLAKDCGLRKQDSVDSLPLMGIDDQAGADEDDFHTFKRRRQEVEKDVKTEDTKKKMLQLKTGALSGVVKSFGATPKATKKVVYF
ncbi:hypothetical protein P691DRAFT_804657 [Macrolepiota fuliginosa MF-IS2]|uniref:CCHC-type domain-containing protein n=1 Tax=Macrolepiota fuliginosa MF-IS2 TaxID=1400762 RepID=A0A9P5X7W8_9AGAR|nr:hypothetical protein P691DRAFT_804657 [Macrolepiota fuliginosa MF-IS2]